MENLDRKEEIKIKIENPKNNADKKHCQPIYNMISGKKHITTNIT